MSFSDFVTQIQERELSDKELKRREEIAKAMVKAHSMEIKNVKGDDREILVQVVANLLD